MPINVEQISKGDILLDNDPRRKGREIEVIFVDWTHHKIRYRTPKRVEEIALHRIFADNKVRSVGFNIKPKTEA